MLLFIEQKRGLNAKMLSGKPQQDLARLHSNVLTMPKRKDISSHLKESAAAAYLSGKTYKVI